LPNTIFTPRQTLGNSQNSNTINPQRIPINTAGWANINQPPVISALSSPNEAAILLTGSG